MKLFRLTVSILLLLAGMLQAAEAPKAKTGKQRNRPDIPEVARKDAICFAYYTLSGGVLKMTAQLYPLREGESREAVLEIQEGSAWKPLVRARVTEDDYKNYRNDKTWTAHFRVDKWNDSRSVRYRVVALNGVATYEGIIRANPIGKKQIVVAAFTGNGNGDRRGKPDMIANLKAQDPDLLFFSGDQSYDHEDHLGAWLLFGRQFGDIIRDRPMVSIPDDHDVGQGNIWGAEGKAAKSPAGDDGGYYWPVEYVNGVQRAQTWHLPDPVDPAPIQRGIGVYFTRLEWGGVSFAIIEDRKFKTGPNGAVAIVPKLGPRPDHVTNPDYDPKALDVPGAKLLGERQEKFLQTWGEDWRGAEFKVVLSQTIFSYATNLSRGQRLLADLDSCGWPQSARQRAVDLMRRCFAFHISGDQHLAVVAQYGVDEWRDASFAFCVPSITNYYPREWQPAGPPANAIKGPLPHLGDYTEGFGNKLTMYAYANPTAFPAPLDNLAASASGYGLVRFDKPTRKITIECWPRGVDATKSGAAQFTGWPITVSQEDNYGRKPVAYLPALRIEGMEDSVVQVIDEATNAVVYTIRINGTSFRPKVFKSGPYTVKVGEPGTPKLKVLRGIKSLPADRAETLTVRL